MLLDPGDAESAIFEGREAAEALMIDRCIVERRTGETVTDPVTGVVGDAWARVYPTESDIAAGNDGKCKVQGRTAVAIEPSAAGHQFTIEQLMLHLPVSAKSQADDRVTIVAATIDPDLAGAEFRLTELARGTYRTADRWNVEMVTA